MNCVRRASCVGNSLGFQSEKMLDIAHVESFVCQCGVSSETTDDGRM